MVLHVPIESIMGKYAPSYLYFFSTGWTNYLFGHVLSFRRTFSPHYGLNYSKFDSNCQ